MTGEALQVSYILEGSVRKHGNRIRISAQLVDVKNGNDLWGERFDGTVDDVFDLQADVARNIADAMKVSISASQQQALGKKPTVDLRAYDCYLRGKDLLFLRGKKNNEAAIRMLEQAIALDPHFAAAYAALAEAFSYMYNWYDGDVQWLSRAAAMSAKALEFEPGLAEARFGLGMVRFYEENYDAARALWEQAVRERPDFFDAYKWLGIEAVLRKEYATALHCYETCEQLKPYSEEPPMYRYMLELHREDAGAAHVAIEKMVAVGLKKLAVNPDDAVTLSRLAAPVGHLGDRSKAYEFLERVQLVAPDDGLILYNSACAYSTLGELDRAVACLRKALDHGFKNTVMWVEHDPDLKAVREHPSYLAMINAPPR
jgi:adenylate cyclase